VYVSNAIEIEKLISDLVVLTLEAASSRSRPFRQIPIKNDLKTPLDSFL